MNLKKIHDKYYISIYQLRQLGFDYPPKGTSVIYDTWLTMGCHWYKFHEKKENWDGIFISPFLSEIGKISVSEVDCLIEFNPKIFEYK